MAAETTETDSGGETSEAPIVVASNRLPFTLARDADGQLASRPSSGGLVAALDPVLRRRGGTWVGWPGLELADGETIPGLDRPYKVEPVHLSSEDADLHYHGFSNGSIWPLFHSMPQRALFEPDDYARYANVNERFATAISRQLGDDDLVWIHDYHLLTVGEPLRQLRPHARLAFFLHIPFPPYDLFRLLPWAESAQDQVISSEHVSGLAAGGASGAVSEGAQQLDHIPSHELPAATDMFESFLRASTSNGVKTSIGVDGSAASSCGPVFDEFAPGSAQYLPGLHIAGRRSSQGARTAIREEVAAPPKEGCVNVKRRHERCSPTASPS